LKSNVTPYTATVLTESSLERQAPKLPRSIVREEKKVPELRPPNVYSKKQTRELPPQPQRKRVRVKLTVVQAKDVPFVHQLLSAVDPHCRLCFQDRMHDTGQEKFNFRFEEPKVERKLMISMGDADDNDVFRGSGPSNHAIAEADVALPNEEGTLERKYGIMSA
jgi:hypothetical protein